MVISLLYFRIKELFSILISTEVKCKFFIIVLLIIFLQPPLQIPLDIFRFLLPSLFTFQCKGNIEFSVFVQESSFMRLKRHMCFGLGSIGILEHGLRLQESIHQRYEEDHD